MTIEKPSPQFTTTLLTNIDIQSMAQVDYSIIVNVWFLRYDGIVESILRSIQDEVNNQIKEFTNDNRKRNGYSYSKSSLGSN